MVTFPLLAVIFIMKVIMVLFLICCVTLVLLVLIQKGRGGGLSAAFGGGMASGILGSKTGDFLTWVTVVLVGVFLILAVLMAKFYKPSVSAFDAGQAPRTAIPAEQPQTSQPAPPIDDIATTPSDTNS